MADKKLRVWLPLTVSLSIVVGMWLGYELRARTSGERLFEVKGKTGIQELLELIRNKYVDDVALDSLSDKTMGYILSQLDPHSVYLPPADVQASTEDLLGQFSGVGIEFQMIKDTVHVMDVVKGGPSEKAGVLPGDILLKANDTVQLSGKKITTAEIRKTLRGEKGSKVKVQVLRDNQLKEIIIERGNVQVSTVDVSMKLDSITGYIKLNKFGERTYEEFMQELEKLQQQGMKRLVLDLRGNGGGMMKEAVDIADEFLSGNKLIVYTEGRRSPRTEYRAKRDGLFEEGKLAVLMDESSASASEVLAGALQDWDRAIVVGQPSFGKGLVQEQFTLSDRSAVRLTVARYFTPLGRNIQQPYSDGKAAYQERHAKRRMSSLMQDSTLQEAHNGKSFTTPAGKKLFGGGGIEPDKWVNGDTVKLSTTAMQVLRQDILQTWSYRLYKKYGKKLQGAVSLNQLQEVLKLDGDDWKVFNELQIEQGLQPVQMMASDQIYLVKRAALNIARYIWKGQEYYKFILKDDVALKSAVLSF